MERKLNVSSGAGGKVSVSRARFDAHLDHCTGCQNTGMCPTAQSLWRSVVLAAMRVRQANGPVGGAK